MKTILRTLRDTLNSLSENELDYFEKLLTQQNNISHYFSFLTNIQSISNSIEQIKELHKEYLRKK